MSEQACVCAPEPPIDYGRAWTLVTHAQHNKHAWLCSRCGGIATDEQRRALDEAIAIARLQAGDERFRRRL